MKLYLLTQRPRLKKFLLWSGGGFLALVLFGFLALPPIVKHFAAKALEEKFHRPVTIRELGINPLSLSVKVAGFSMKERGGTEFFAIDELYANLGMVSILEGAPVLHEIRVKAPYFKLVRKADGAYNIDDIVAELLKPSDSPARYSISNILVDGGKIEFDDAPKHIQHTVSDLHLAIPFLSNLPYQDEIHVKPTFSAKLNGAPMHLTGRVKPFSKNRDSVVKLDVAGLDLAPYFEYLPLQQKIRLVSAKLDANMEISFSQEPKKPPMVLLSGKASLKDVVATHGADKSLARLALLSLDLQSADVGRKKVVLRSLVLQQPELHLPEGLPQLEADEAKAVGGTLDWSSPAPLLSQQEFAVSGLRLKAAGEKDPRIEIGALEVKDVAVDLGKRMAMLGAFTTSGGKVAVRRDKQGAVDLLGWLGAGKATPASGTPQAEEKPWQFSLKTLSLGEYALRFSDEFPEDPVNLAAEGIKIDASDISSGKDQMAKLALDLRLNKGGVLSLTGSAGLNPVVADFSLDMKTASLKPFQPYFTEFLTVTLTDGSASAKGKLRVEAVSGGTPKMAFNGDFSINRLATIDKDEEEDFLKWSALSFRRVNAVTQPLRLDVAEIELDKFYSRLVVNQDGSLNLQHVLKTEGKPAPAAQPQGAQDGRQVAQPDYRIDIAKVTLRNGQVDFSDYFIKPNYSAHLTGLGGSVTGLSSNAGLLAEVALKGRVDNQGQLGINGKINPLAGNLFLDLLASLQDFELSSLAPYSAKYAGYGIQKGKLSFDVKYRVENRKLTAENHLFLNQLTFGDKVESPVATKLPVLLAVALLKDRSGNIDVNLPISGSLDDPQFSLGGIIFKVIINLIAKAVTSPFALLGSLFGGGEELAYLEFEYGKDVLGKEAETKLNAIALALNERPRLKLDIGGQVDAEKDSEGIRQLELERKVKAQKLKDLLQRSDFSGSVDEVKVEQGEYARYLSAAYKQEKIPTKPRNLVGFVKDIPLAEMEKLMLANFDVSEGDLRDLANHRAQEAKEYLVNVGKVAAERIFILAPQDTKANQEKAKLSRVNFVLGAR